MWDSSFKEFSLGTRVGGLEQGRRIAKFSQIERVIMNYSVKEATWDEEENG